MNAATGRVVLSCEGVRKSFGRRVVLDDIGFQLEEGSVLGLLGPNGAGKTSIMKSVLGLLYPDDGEIRILGHDVAAKRELALSRVGAIIEAPVFPGYLTGYECLLHLSSLTARTERSRIMDVLELVGLKSVAGTRVDSYSFGMKQRLGIAQALLPDSKLLILDEPTNGLDPHGIAGVRKLLRHLSKEMGVSIMVSSHLLKEMEEVCDHLVVIHHGRKVLDSSSSELRRKHESVSIAVLGGPCEELKKLEGFLSEAPSPDNPASMLYKFSTIPAKTPELVKAAVGLGARIHGVSHEKLDLENIFIKLTSEGGLNVRADSF